MLTAVLVTLLLSENLVQKGVLELMARKAKNIVRSLANSSLSSLSSVSVLFQIEVPSANNPLLAIELPLLFLVSIHNNMAF